MKTDDLVAQLAQVWHCIASRHRYFFQVYTMVSGHHHMKSRVHGGGQVLQHAHEKIADCATLGRWAVVTDKCTAPLQVAPLRAVTLQSLPSPSR